VAHAHFIPRVEFARFGRSDAKIVGVALRDSTKRVDKTEGARVHP
jgi:hypothetical protein